MVVFKTYEVSNLYNLRIWSRNLLRSVFLWAVAVWAFIGLFQITTFAPRLGAVYCIGFLAVLVTLWRLLSFVFLIQPSIKEAASSRVIVVGWNEKVAHLRKAVRKDLSQLVEIIGCVPMPGGHFANKPPVELAILGDYSAIPRIVSECKANAIILSDVSCPAREIQDLIGFCNREMIAFKMVPEYFPALNSGLQVQTLSGVPPARGDRAPLDRTLNRMVKRVLDIVGSLAGLALCAVIVPPFALLVRLDPGPGLLSPAPDEPRRPDVQHLEDPQHARRRGVGYGSGLVLPGGRRCSAASRSGCSCAGTTSMSCRSSGTCSGGHEPGRPEAGKARAHNPVQGRDPELQRSPRGAGRPHRVGPDPRPARRHRPRKRIEADLYYLENWNVLIDLYCIAATFFRVKNAH